MHHIQYSIVALLMKAGKKRFSELKPEGLESNLFQYHLKHTIKEGYVIKVDGGYALSPKGLYFADRHSSLLKTIREQPKTITILVLQNRQGEVLMQQKSRQPFIGSFHLPAGKIHEGETVHDAAQREIVEKTGLTSVELMYRSTVHVHISQNDTLISEYIGFVFGGQYTGNVEEGVWRDFYDTRELAPSVAEVLASSKSEFGPPKEIFISL
jgi:8-oxo-dGTP pyrophosphatase MutT (NUDIX family)